MPSESRPGRKGFYVELPDELDAEFRAFVERYELGTIAQHVRMAIRRHMAAPPAVTVPPLPAERMDGAAPPAPAEVPKKRGRPPKSKPEGGGS